MGVAKKLVASNILFKKFEYSTHHRSNRRIGCFGESTVLFTHCIFTFHSSIRIPQNLEFISKKSFSLMHEYVQASFNTCKLFVLIRLNPQREILTLIGKALGSIFFTVNIIITI